MLVGEVWLCSGQSNMEMTVGGVANKDAEIAAANYPQIRMYFIDHIPAQEPQATARRPLGRVQPADRGRLLRRGLLLRPRACTSN